MVGYGEVVSFPNSFYLSETLDKSLEWILYVSKRILKEEIFNSDKLYKMFPTNMHMAFAGLENAFLDLEARKYGYNTVSKLFNTKLNSTIDTGYVISDVSFNKTYDAIIDGISNGCRRFKIKINPITGVDKMYFLRKEFPDIKFLVDANQSYSIKQISLLERLDELNLVCIEEPLVYEELISSINFQNKFKTPICLDESIDSIDKLIKARENNLFSVLNIKIGKFGGLYQVKKVIKYCKSNGIKFWIGSMVETGISKILHVQLAAVGGTYIPGDLSESSRYFQEDLIIPDINSQNGKIDVPTGIGSGVDINEKLLYTFTKERWEIQ